MVNPVTISMGKVTIPSNYREASSILGEKLKIQRGTGNRLVEIIRRDDCCILFRFGGITLVQFHNNGDMVLNGGQFRIKSIKNKLNEAIWEVATIFQKKFQWFVKIHASKQVLPFRDGMILNKLSAFY